MPQQSVPTTSARGGLAGRFRNLGVATKILASVGIASVVAVLVGATGLSALGSTSQATKDMYTSNVKGTSLAQEMRYQMVSIRFNSAAAGVNPKSAATFIAAREAAHQALIEAGRSYLADTAPPAAAKQVVNQTLADVESYFVLLPQANALQAAGKLDEFSAILATKVNPLMQKIVGNLDILQKGQLADSAAKAADAKSSYSHTRTLLVLVLLGGLLLALGCGLVVARSVTGPLRKVRAATARLAQGDLTVPTGVQQNDEVGQTAASLDTALEFLRSVLTSVGESADAVAASSEELSASSAQISVSAQDTSSQSAVVSTAATEVSRSVQTVAAGAEQMGASIREIATNASAAARVASQAVGVAQQTNDTVAKLGESSREIGNVIKVITTIAEQTNLLALNATIEAARAGEAGKGFAVVASEVKDLAQETARATEDIGRRVQAIQDDTGSAVDAIAEITAIIASINDFQTTIASAVEEQTATTNEMSRSVAEAANGSGDIAENISGVVTAADFTTHALGETQAAVNELAGMASALRGTVARFTY